jgi:hypothetical protein
MTPPLPAALTCRRWSSDKRLMSRRRFTMNSSSWYLMQTLKSHKGNMAWCDNRYIGLCVSTDQMLGIELLMDITPIIEKYFEYNHALILLSFERK